MTDRARSGAPFFRALDARTLRARFRRRLAAAYAVVLPAVAIASASPALAVHRSDGDDPGKGISALHTLGVYVGIPVGVAVVLWLLTFAPSTTRGPRYRPGTGWTADSTWLGDEGGSRAALPGAAAEKPADAPGSGGASGRW